MTIYLKPCGGCLYHEFPYFARQTPLVDETGRVVSQRFENLEDIMKFISRYKKQRMEFLKSRGITEDWGYSLAALIPFFACPNHFIDKEALSVIARYNYCERFPATSPFDGSFSDLPKKWLSYVGTIANCYNIIDRQKRRELNA